MKLKTKLSTFAILLFTLILLPCTVFASQAVVDEAELFTPEQEASLAEDIGVLQGQYGVDITLLTIYDTGGMDGESYTEFHPAIDQSRDGIVFSLDPYNREFHTIGRGFGITVLSDAALERIDSTVASYFADADYYGGFSSFVSMTEIFLEATEDGGFYTAPLFEPGTLVLALVVGLGAGLIVAFLVTGSMIKQMKTAQKQHHAASYMKDGSLQLSVRHDQFLYENVTKTAIQKNTSSSGGGGGSSHSSGGRSSGSY